MDTTVYRVEHPDTHIGPYQGGAEHERVMSSETLEWVRVMRRVHTDYMNHPNPYLEGLTINDDELCGFASMDDLLIWFRGWLPFLFEAGFRVAKYRVPVECVRYGRHQVVFGPVPRGWAW